MNYLLNTTQKRTELTNHYLEIKGHATALILADSQLANEGTIKLLETLTADYFSAFENLNKLNGQTFD
jgi:hypothetical protein